MNTCCASRMCWDDAIQGWRFSGKCNYIDCPDCNRVIKPATEEELAEALKPMVIDVDPNKALLDSYTVVNMADIAHAISEYMT